jgi:hypothetical protein
MSIITAIDGYRLIADRTGRYCGNDEPRFSGSKVVDNVRVPDSCTVTVWKLVGGQRMPFSATCYWDEYYPGGRRGHMWRKMPHGQLAKVTEAAALRKAFPADLSGMYTNDEMEQAAPFEPPTAPAVIEDGVIVEDAPPTNGNGMNGHHNNGPMPDDELVIRESSGREFFTLTAVLLGMTADEVKAAVQQTGATSIPGNADKRVELYRHVKEGLARQPELLAVTPGDPA